MGGNFPPLYITSSFTVLFTLLRQLFFWWNCSHQSISDIWTSDFKSAKDDGINESPLNQSLEHVMRNIYCTISHVSSLESLDKPSSIEMWSESGFLSKEHENEQLSKEVDLDDNQLKTEKHNSNVTSADTVAKKMKSKFTKSWITYLRVPLPLDVYKELLDSCLKSAFLPAYLAASFVKKLIRLLLSVSPSGSLVIIALIHNLLRRHPSINCLVHQIVQVTLILLLSSKEPRRREFSLGDRYHSSPLLSSCFKICCLLGMI